MAQVDPWGVTWLSKADGLPVTFWANTDTTTLAPLFADLKPATLAPSARAALRRVVLSSAKGPTGADDLIPERLRLIEQVGETERSIDLRRKFPKATWGPAADRIASDYDLVSGRNETACSRVADKRADDPNWMPVRALCYAVAKDYNQAGLVAEQLMDGEAKPDLWLLSAVETMREPTKTKPAGRYGAALEAAVSIAAKLSVPNGAMAATPSDVAVAIVRHPNATSEQKRAALRIAIETGKITPAETLAILMVPPEEKPAATTARATQRPSSDFLALALAAAVKTDLAADAKAAAYAAALKASDTQGDARIAAYALHDALKALAKTEATAPNAETFARAALIANDVKLAQDWRKMMDAAKDKDEWAAARIDMMLSFAGVGEEKSTALLQHLMATLPADDPPADTKPDPKAKAPAKAEPKLSAAQQRQLDLRRIETTRVLFLYVGAGRPLPGSARTALASQKNAGRGVPDAMLARIQASADANANGEAALAAIALLGSDVSALSFSGLADLLTQLRRAGLEKDADAIALESLQPWKAL
jgi:hypothetical protein